MAEDKGNKTRDAADRDEEDLGAGPDDGKIRRGPESSKSLKYSQEVTSPDDEPEREGRSLATTHHAPRSHQAVGRGARRRAGHR